MTISYAEVMRLKRPDGGTTVVDSYHQSASRGTTEKSASRGTTWERPNLEQLNLKIKRQVAEKFKIWCSLNGISLARGFEKAVAILVDGGTTGSTGSVVPPTTTSLIDDLDDDDNIIIAFYRELTGNKFTDSDKQALKEMRSSGMTSERIQMGIALSVYRTKKRINSFRYCCGAMNEAAEARIQMPKNYIAHVKSKIKQRRTTD
jgi:hypothetical protein